MDCTSSRIKGMNLASRKGKAKMSLHGAHSSTNLRITAPRGVLTCTR